MTSIHLYLTRVLLTCHHRMAAAEPAEWLRARAAGWMAAVVAGCVVTPLMSKTRETRPADPLLPRTAAPRAALRDAARC